MFIHLVIYLVIHLVIYLFIYFGGGVACECLHDLCLFPRHSQLHVVEETTETNQVCSAKSGTIVQGKIVCLAGWLSGCLSGWLDVCTTIVHEQFL